MFLIIPDDLIILEGRKCPRTKIKIEPPALILHPVVFTEELLYLEIFGVIAVFIEVISDKSRCSVAICYIAVIKILNIEYSVIVQVCFFTF